MTSSFILVSDETGQKNGIQIGIPFAKGNIYLSKDVRPLLLQKVA